MTQRKFTDRARRRCVGILILTAAFAAVSCYDSRFRNPDSEDSIEPVSETIKNIKNKFLGTPFVVSADISVEGWVSTSDQKGNFYRTFCVEYEHDALEILAGIDHIHNKFPEGTHVRISLAGLTVAEYLGVIRIGTEPLPGSGYDTDYIGSIPALDKVVVRCSEELSPPEPLRLTIPELSSQWCGSLVRIDNIRFEPDDDADVSWSGYKKFVDSLNNTVYSYVRTYADFASDPIPEGEVGLIGVLLYDSSGDGKFIIKPRNETDCIY